MTLKIPAFTGFNRAAEAVPPHAWFGVSAVFHYLGPSFAVLLFPAVGVLGVAWFRIASAALIFAPFTKPWRTLRDADGRTRVLLIGLGFCLAVMNTSFYLALDKLPMSLVAAMEFVGYIMLGHKAAEGGASGGVARLGAAMAIAFILLMPIGFMEALQAFGSITLILAGIGVGICSSVIPYVCDQLAMSRLPRASFALLLALLPATATIIAALVLAQIPSVQDILGIVLVMAGIALHRPAKV